MNKQKKTAIVFTLMIFGLGLCFHSFGPFLTGEHKVDGGLCISGIVTLTMAFLLNNIAIGSYLFSLFMTFLSLTSQHGVEPRDFLNRLFHFDRHLRFDIEMNSMEMFSKVYPWYNEIIPGLYLGALPLENLDHQKQLLENEGIGAVVSLVEPWEFKHRSQIARPIQPSTWEKLGIDHLQISTKDWSPVQSSRIDEAVEFIHQELQKGKRVYVHCKAGRGRSASVVICYLMKYHHVSAREAIAKVKVARPQIQLGNVHRKAIQVYQKRFLFKDESLLFLLFSY